VLIREIGTDFLYASHIVTHAMREKLGAPYYERLQAYHAYVAENDLAMGVAQTDVKGDRSRGPSEQEHPDYYVRVVDRQKGGIVVRGAKAHTTNPIFANELIVLPPRAMGEADREYALSFAVPVNARGLKFIASPFSGGGDSPIDHPVSSRHKVADTLTIFDDVFVPWDRVFLCGEASYAGGLIVTGPSEEDLKNPETKAYVEHYLGGKAGFGSVNRLKLLNLIRDYFASSFGGYHELLAIHAEGSLEAQKITILRGFDTSDAVAFAAECAGVDLPPAR